MRQLLSLVKRLPAKEQIRATEAAVQQAEEAYKIATVRYTSGVGINLDVLDAQKHLRLQIGISSYHDYHIRVFHDLKAFCQLLDQMEEERRKEGIHPIQMEQDSNPNQRQTLPSIFRSISI